MIYTWMSRSELLMIVKLYKWYAFDIWARSFWVWACVRCKSRGTSDSEMAGDRCSMMNDCLAHTKDYIQSNKLFGLFRHLIVRVFMFGTRRTNIHNTDSDWEEQKKISKVNYTIQIQYWMLRASLWNICINLSKYCEQTSRPNRMNISWEYHDLYEHNNCEYDLLILCHLCVLAYLAYLPSVRAVWKRLANLANIELEI